MHFALSEDQIAIRDMARDFAAEKIAPGALEWDEKKHFPIERGVLRFGEFKLKSEGVGLFNSDDALFANLVEGLGNGVTNAWVLS